MKFTYLAAAALVAAYAAVFATIRRTRDMALNNYRSVPYEAELAVREAEEWRPANNGWGSFTAQADGFKVKVIFPLKDLTAMPQPGEIWRVCGRLGREERGVRKLWVKGEQAGIEKTGELKTRNLMTWCARLKRKLSKRMGLGVDATTANLNRAIILGERWRIDGESRAGFITAGRMHVFAISGLHVMVVAKTMLILLALLAVPHRTAPAVMLPFLWLYVYMTGLSPSAVRAATMATFYFSAGIFRRKANALVAWSLTFIIIHLIDPMSILEVGSVLSFTVMFAILLIGRYLEDFPPSKWHFLAYSTAAWAAGVPVTAHVFGQVTPAGIVANLALVPIAAVEVSVGFAGMLAGMVSDAAGTLMNGLASLVIKLMYAISYAAAHLPFASVEVEPWGWRAVVLWYASALAALWIFRKAYFAWRVKI